MKSIVFTIVLALCSYASADANDRGVNTFAVDVVHVSGGIFYWQELGGGENRYYWNNDAEDDVFQVSFEVEGSIDIEFFSVTGLNVYATNGGVVPTLAIGDVTFSDGYYVLQGDNTVASSIEFHTPGASPLRGSTLPLWLEINTAESDAHWEIRDGNIVYEFTGGGDQSSFYGELSNSTGAISDQEGYGYGPMWTSGMTFPGETDRGAVVIDTGTSYVLAGPWTQTSFSEDPYRVVFEFGDSGTDPLPEDLDGDGVVGLSDLLQLIAAWDSTTP